MSAIDFSVEEMNAIAIYHSNTKELTILRMTNAAEYITDDSLWIIFSTAIKKLKQLTQEEFEKIEFVLTE